MYIIIVNVLMGCYFLISSINDEYNLINDLVKCIPEVLTNV